MNDIFTIEEIIQHVKERDDQNWTEHETMTYNIQRNRYDIEALKSDRAGGGRTDIGESSSQSGYGNVEVDGQHYTYTEEKLHSFDTKIDVCKWFSKLYGGLNNGKYNISIRKNGIMCKMRKVTELACEQAYNYKLCDTAAPSDETETLVAKYGSGLTKTINLFTHDGENFDLDDNTVDWYLSNPYVIPIDMTENWTQNNLFFLGDAAGGNCQKVASNCIAAFDCTQDTQIANTKIVVTVIGAGRRYKTYTPRPGLPSSWTQSSQTLLPQDIKDLGETIAKELYEYWIDWYEGGRQGAFNPGVKEAMYVSVAEQTRYGGSNIVYENYCGAGIYESRFHIMTAASQLILAKYIADCDDEEIVDFEFNTMRLYELSNPSQPEGFPNSTLGILDFGYNQKVYDMTATLEDVWRCACWNDNPYCIYGLYLHLYKGLTHTVKDSISPLIETYCSWDEGYVEISFPEMKRADITSNESENQMSYQSNTYTHTPVKTFFHITHPTYNDIVYYIDLTDTKLEFNNFTMTDMFTLTFEFNMENYTTSGETLIATVGTSEIYLCYNSRAIYNYLNKFSGISKVRAAVKIVDGKSQLYMGIPVLDEDKGAHWNTIIDIGYYHGFWNINQCHQARGQN